ncbi:hypothetical protein V6Z11_A10G094700 [Gossypium hirsutum]
MVFEGDSLTVIKKICSTHEDWSKIAAFIKKVEVEVIVAVDIWWVDLLD